MRRQLAYLGAGGGRGRAPIPGECPPAPAEVLPPQSQLGAGAGVCVSGRVCAWTAGRLGLQVRLGLPVRQGLQDHRGQGRGRGRDQGQGRGRGQPRRDVRPFGAAGEGRWQAQGARRADARPTVVLH